MVDGPLVHVVLQDRYGSALRSSYEPSSKLERAKH